MENIPLYLTKGFFFVKIVIYGIYERKKDFTIMRFGRGIYFV